MLNINFWNIVFTIINVLVLYGLMKKFLVKPVMGMIEKREQMIEGQLSDARENQTQAQELKEQYEGKIKNAEDEAKAIVVQAREQAQEEKKHVLEETRMESAQLMEKAQQDIVNEQEKAKRETESQIAELAMLAARKILKTGEAHDANSH